MSSVTVEDDPRFGQHALQRRGCVGEGVADASGQDQVADRPAHRPPADGLAAGARRGRCIFRLKDTPPSTIRCWPWM